MSVEDREKIAREAGWTPEGEWDEKKTPPKSFKTADEFLDDAPMMLLSTRKAVSKLESQLKETNEKLRETVTDSRANNALVKRIHQRELREQEREILSRKRDKAEAIAEGDVEAGIAADRDIALLEADTQPTGSGSNGISPQQQAVVDQWVAVNPWYARDPELREVAATISTQLETEGVPPGQQRLAAVSREVRARYPDRTSDPVYGGAPGNPASGVQSVNRSSGRAFDDLPKAAQDAYNRFKKLNPTLTKPQYLAEYEWEQG